MHGDNHNHILNELRLTLNFKVKCQGHNIDVFFKKYPDID